MRPLSEFLKSHYKNYIVSLIILYSIFISMNLAIIYLMVKKNTHSVSAFVDVYFQHFENELEEKSKQLKKIFEDLESAFKTGKVKDAKSMDKYLQEKFDIKLDTAIISDNGVITDTNNPSELGLNLTQFPDAKDTFGNAKKTLSLYIDYPVFSYDFQKTYIYLLKYVPQKNIYLQTGYQIRLYSDLLSKLSQILKNYDFHYNLSIYHVYFGKKPEVGGKAYGYEEFDCNEVVKNTKFLSEKTLTKSSLFDFTLFKLIKNKTNYGLIFIFHLKPLLTSQLITLAGFNIFFLVGIILSYIYFPKKIRKYVVTPLKILSERIKNAEPFDYKSEIEEITIISNSYKNHLEAIKVRDFLKEVINAKEAERERIAKDVHDTVLQELNYMLIMLKQQDNAELAGILKEQIRKLRKLIIDEDIVLAKNLGLLKFVETYIKHLWEHNSQINFHFENNCSFNINFAPEINIHIIRVIKEIIHNSIKHSRCKNIYLKLKNDDKFLHIFASDDGVGFNTDDVETSKDHLGLTSIRERLFIINATFELISNKNGTEYNIKIPLQN
jgi:signal transduction histidine kinase